jgi:DNA-directed RNA polymerase subunit alpha
VIRASDMVSEPGLEVMNPDQRIAVLEPGAALALELEVDVGRGYVPAARIQAPPGAIRLDASFSPIRKVSYSVGNARVGQRVDYERLVVEVWTNGSVHPRVAPGFAAELLREQLRIFINFEEADEVVEASAPEVEPVNENLFRSVDELDLSVRAMNCLQTAKIELIGDLVQKSDRALLETRNFGVKSLREIQLGLEALGLSLGMKLEDWPRMVEAWRDRSMQA